MTILNVEEFPSQFKRGSRASPRSLNTAEMEQLAETPYAIVFEIYMAMQISFHTNNAETAVLKLYLTQT